MTRAGAGVAAALATLALVAVGGCGGEERLSKDEYETAVRSAYQDVRLTFARTFGASGADLGTRVSDAQASLRRAADRLEDAEPPEEVEEENEELVEGLRSYAEELERLHTAVEGGNADRITEVTEALQETDAVEQIAEAAEEMKFKGYDLGRISSD